VKQWLYCKVELVTSNKSRCVCLMKQPAYWTWCVLMIVLRKREIVMYVRCCADVITNCEPAGKYVCMNITNFLLYTTQRWKNVAVKWSPLLRHVRKAPGSTADQRTKCSIWNVLWFSCFLWGNGRVSFIMKVDHFLPSHSTLFSDYPKIQCCMFWAADIIQ
jgi:hypothetical protein